MGLIGRIMGTLFGGGRNVVAETAEVFFENKEASSQRNAEFKSAVLEQFSHEFAASRLGWFDRIIDALNRVPRPAMALGTLALFVAAMKDPVWFASRMQGLSLVPEPMWWLMGAVVSFYFGARFQLKSQEFHKSLAETLARAPSVVHNIEELSNLRTDAETPGIADPGTDAKVLESAVLPSDNPALDEWKKAHKVHAANG